MKGYIYNTILTALTALALSACNGRATTGTTSVTPTTDTLVAAPTFNADSAMSYLRRQCDFGPRVPGTAAHRACGEWISRAFAATGARTADHNTTVRGYDGKEMPCRNIMAFANPDAGPRILITAHWDSRAWADNDPDADNHRTPVPAANDGASGIAVMLELARLIADMPPAIGVDFVCFDAEDQGHPQWDDSYDDEADEAGFWCLGSRAWAEEAFSRGYTARFAINLDMVGGRGARFAVEGYSQRSAPSVAQLVWAKAALLGHDDIFTNTTGGYVMDDHVSVIQLANIPAIDIIPNVDDPRSSFGRTWHTLSDTPDAIDPDILAAVGQTILQVIYSMK